MKLQLFTCEGYHEGGACQCHHFYQKKNKFIRHWDCRCGTRRFWIVRLIAKLLGDKMTRL